MRKRFTFLARTLLALLLPSAAWADTYTFSASASGLSASGTVTVEASSTAGVYDITGVSGSVDGNAITGLLPTSYDPAHPTYNAAGNFYYDNLLYLSPGSAYLDGNGAGLVLGNGDDDINFFYNTALGEYEFQDSNGSGAIALGSFDLTLVSTPEPSSWLLLATASAAGAALARRRRPVTT